MPTPFREDGELDTEKIGALVDRLVEGGVNGLFPVGTSGEFFLLSRAERKKVIEAVVTRANGRVQVLAGICDSSPRNAVVYAKDAKEAGADGAIATPPYPHAAAEESIYAHFRIIQESISLPLVLYDIPEWTHNPVPISVVNRLAEEGRIVGVKYTEYNFLKLQRLITTVGNKIDVVTGSDAMALACVETGGAGAAISISNVFPREASSIHSLAKAHKHDEALELQQRLLPGVEAIGIGNFPAGLKEAMKIVGFPVGEVRKPLSPVSLKERDEITNLLRQVQTAERQA